MEKTPKDRPARTKVLFFIGSYVLGGKERQMTELIKSLPTERFEVYLLVKSIRIYYFEQIRDKVEGYYSLETERFIYFNAIFKSIKYIRDLSPMIIHCWSDETSILAIFARIFTHKKYAVIDGSIRDSWFPYGFFHHKWWLRIFINRFSTLSISNSVAGLRAYLVDNNKGMCIHNGFNFTRIVNLPSVNEIKALYEIHTDFVVGMVGRFNPHKDWDLFFKTANSICEWRKDITFMAIGDGIQYEMLRDRYSYNQNILFTGQTSQVEQLISIFDIGILLTNGKSHAEGLSNSIMEYMALGKPVIANRNGGNEELIEQNVTGYIIEGGSESEVIGKIELLLTNLDLRIRLGSKGKERLLSKFNMDKMIHAYNQVYLNLIAGRA